MNNMTRRSFLKFVGVTTAGLAANSLLGKAQAPQPEYLVHLDDPLGVPRIPPGPPPDHYDYHGWETLYKEQWAFDTFSRTAHSMNCTGNCTWRGYVKNGILFKEEQFADYPEIYTDVPCYNPRGCQKGANYKEYIYGPQRVKYPLIRADLGDKTTRGAGNFRKATWAEALGLIAGKVVQTIQTPWTDASGVSHSFSPDQVFFYAAIPAKHHVTLAGGFRLANLLGAPLNSFYDWYCDLPPGEPMTWGVQTDSCEGADWYRSNFIMLQGANLVETRIPDAHYFAEARYRGCKTVVVSPEYNAVSRMGDVYVAINPGTDAALNLGMAREVVYNNLHDADYIKQFTDLPFLVYTSGPCTGKFVRTYDGQQGDGTPKDPVLFNQYRVYAGGQFVIPPGTMNNGGSLDITPAPDLEVPAGTVYTYQEPGAKKPKGKYTVKTAFTLLKEMLAPYTPDYVSGITGIPAQMIVDLAHDFVNRKPARIIEGAGTNHWFHNDLTNRTQILILALTGNIGYPGSGFDHYVGQEKLWAEDGFFRLSFPYGRPRQRFQNTTLWTYVHSETVSDVDAVLPRPLSQYIADSVNKGWMPLWPKDTLTNLRPPKVLFIWGANYLNQAKGAAQVYNTLWPKLDLIVDVNFRMDTTARYADVVLPASSYFEKFDINTSDLTTWVIPFTPVIDPVQESKPDWEIWRSLAEAIQATGFAGFLDDFEPFNTFHYPTNIRIPGLQRDFTTLLQQFDTWASPSPAPNPTASYPPDTDLMVADQRDAVQWLLDNSPETAGMTIKPADGWVPDPLEDDPAVGDYRFRTMDQKNALPDNSLIKVPQRVIEASEEWTSDVLPGEPYYCFQRMTEHRHPLRTQTGRQQFYLDHDWLLQLGEQLPVYKPPIESDLYPLRWITPHGRWSIHTTWRDAKYQLRLQRGRPIVYLSPNEAAARGLEDNDLVRILNDHGSLEAHLCVAARMPDGMAQMYHGWEKHQVGAGAWQSATTIRINPTELIGKYGQMAFRLNYWGPTGNQKDTRVQIELMEHEADNSGEHWMQDPCAP